MHSKSWQSARLATAAVLAASFPVFQTAAAQTTQHLVTPQELSKAAQDATQVRQQNLTTLRGILSSPKAQEALESAHMDSKQVQAAVGSLSDQELAQLAERASKSQNEFAAGNMSDRDLLIILVAIAALILIIVAVH